MQMSKLFFSALVAISAFGGLYADQSKPKVRKIHIQVKTISQANGGILVQTTAGPVLLKTLRCDQQGVFFTKCDMVMIKGVRRHREENHNSPMMRRCPYCDAVRYNEWEYWDHVDNCPENPNNGKRR
jgi:uncharacterized C2H2 Zn-finger protein